MHSLKVNIPDALFPQVVSCLRQFSSSGVEFEEFKDSGFIISNIDEAKERIKEARASIQKGHFIEEDAFWMSVDKHLDAL